MSQIADVRKYLVGSIADSIQEMPENKKSILTRKINNLMSQIAKDEGFDLKTDEVLDYENRPLKKNAQILFNQLEALTKEFL